MPKSPTNNMDQISHSVIAIHNLTKQFDKATAVNHISLAIRQGEVFAFLGQNGAGKSTTIKMLTTLLRPTAGDVSIAGFDLTRQAPDVRRIIGYVPQLISADGTLTCYENLMLMARLYDVPARERKERVREVLSFIQLEAHADALVRTFSGGMIRRLEIGQAIIHRPKVLFLDEPTSGLDPMARQNIWKHIMELRDHHGTTIFFSTHQMDEAEGLSDRVGIMHKGKLALVGTASEIKEKTGKKNVTLDDAFIFFTGGEAEDRGTFRDARQTRHVQQRLG